MKAMICLILDRSGSMSGLESDVIGGVNKFLEEQKALPDPASIAFVRFDTGATERFRPMGPLAECKPLDVSEFKPRGGTPLLDALGATVTALDEDWKREQPERAVVVVFTDGHENASREYTKDKIKSMIQARQDSGKWMFIYLGANVDSFAEAGTMGFAAQNTANYVGSGVGTRSAYAAMSNATLSARASGQTLDCGNLGGDIAEDGTLKQKIDAVAAKAPDVTAWTPPTDKPSVWSPPA